MSFAQHISVRSWASRLTFLVWDSLNPFPAFRASVHGALTGQAIIVFVRCHRVGSVMELEEKVAYHFPVLRAKPNVLALNCSSVSPIRFSTVNLLHVVNVDFRV